MLFALFKNTCGELMGKLKLYVKIGKQFKELADVMPSFGIVKKMLIKDAIAEYIKTCTSQKCTKNQKVEKKIFQDFQEFLNSKSLTELNTITYQDALDFQNLLATKMKNSSVNRRFFTIRHFFGMCERWEFVLKNITKEIRNKKVEANPRKVWTKKQFEQLINECEGIYKSLILFLWHTGCRPMEAKNLKWTDIDHDKLEITLRCGKNAKVKRIFPMTNSVSKILHQINMKGDVVFNNISNDSLYQYISHRLVKLNIKGITPYGIRHTFASRLSNAGVNVFLIKMLMGHADIKTTSIYVHAEKKELHEALKSAKF